MDVCAKTKGNLSFIPQSVDATNPPVSVTSVSSGDSRTADGFRSDTRIFRLYCLAFHHFDDELARKVLASTMETADGFAIIELQDRYLSSIFLMLGHLPIMFGLSIFRYWKDIIMLIFVYLVPLVPVINSFDGLVSGLRTRNFREVMALIGAKVEGERMDGESIVKQAAKDNWVFKSAYEMHSWPVGYMNWIVGYRKSEE